MNSNTTRTPHLDADALVPGPKAIKAEDIDDSYSLRAHSGPGPAPLVDHKGRQYRVPLPENTDPSWVMHLSRCPDMSEVTRLPYFQRTGEKLAKRVLESDAGICVLADESHGLRVSAAFLDYPNQLDLPALEEHVPTPKCYIRQDELLAKVLIKQVEWFEYLRRTPSARRSNVNNEVLQSWLRHPRAQEVIIVAVRRTIPEEDGSVCYFPEIELHLQE